MSFWLSAELSAYVAGRMPIKISMMSPMPCCPSFEPWAKLTPVQVRINKPRIQCGGPFSGSGGAYSSGRLINAFASKSKRPAQQNPTTGEMSSELPTSSAFAQFTPSPNTCDDSIEFAMPTPMIEPISVCELDAGRPRYQVPRFHKIADMSSANTIAQPAPEPTLITNSTGNSATTANATAP